MGLSSLDLVLVATLLLAAMGLFFALVYPHFSGERLAEKRRSVLIQQGQKNRAIRNVDHRQRRKQIAESLRDLDKRGKAARKVSIENRLLQAGFRISKMKFFMASGLCGLVLALIGLVSGFDTSVLLLMFFVGSFGIPRWLLGVLRDRRLKQFGLQFPDAIDVIIRGVKAGLPLIDSLRIVASELPEPIRSEFLLIIESQAIGLTVSKSVERITERVPVAEARFFAILIGIQQQSGGNLAEGLGNLSHVLRDRKRLTKKIKSMSAEAKASAGIIGSLPFVVAGLVQITSPGYMDMFWTTMEGRVMIGISAIWMTIGILVMRRLIFFDT